MLPRPLIPRASLALIISIVSGCNSDPEVALVPHDSVSKTPAVSETRVVSETTEVPESTATSSETSPFSMNGVWHGTLIVEEVDGETIEEYSRSYPVVFRIEEGLMGPKCTFGGKSTTICKFDGSPDSLSLVFERTVEWGSGEYRSEESSRFDLTGVSSSEDGRVVATWKDTRRSKLLDTGEVDESVHFGRVETVRIETIDSAPSMGLSLLGEFGDFSVGGTGADEVFAEAANVRVDGDYAYVVLFRNGFSVLDISKPQDIVEVASVPVEDAGGDYYNDVKIVHSSDDRTYAAISDSLAGLVIYDITDPANPVFSNAFDLTDGTSEIDTEKDPVSETSATSLDLDEGSTSGADTTASDTTDDESSLSSDYWDESEPYLDNHTLFVENDLAYLAISAGSPSFDKTDDFPSGGLLILDLHDPSQPEELGRWRTSEIESGYEAHDLYVKDSIVYLCTWDSGMVILDASDPLNIEQIGHYTYSEDMTSHSVWVTEVDGRVIAAHGGEDVGAHIRLVDVDPASDTFLEDIGEFETRPEVSVHNIMAFGSEIIASYYQDGIRIVDISTPEAPTQSAWFNTWKGLEDPRAGRDFYEGAIGQDVVGNRIYVADTHRGLLILEREVEGGGSLPAASTSSR